MWLAEALQVLTKSGNAKLPVDNIARALGVTKGSFYWHFKNRKDFVAGIIDYWDKQFTRPVIETVSANTGDARHRLWVLMEMVHSRDYARYDASVRAWAAQEPWIFDLCSQVDATRHQFARSLFAEIGFEGLECEMRARACIAYLSYGVTAGPRLNKADRLRMLKLQHELLTRS
jgi:AcrR family transcriptional regulator